MREAVAQLRLEAEKEEDDARNPVSEGNLGLEAEEENEDDIRISSFFPPFISSKMFSELA